MYQAGALYLQFQSPNDAASIFPHVKELLTEASQWQAALALKKASLSIEDGTAITLKEYKGLAEQICATIVQLFPNIEFICISSYYSEAGEIQNSIVMKEGLFQHYEKRIELISDKMYEDFSWGKISDGVLKLRKIDDLESTEEEIKCAGCGEFYTISSLVPVFRCPFCGKIEYGKSSCFSDFQNDKTKEKKAESVHKWKSFHFDIPLGIELPDKSISEGQSWIGECEEDTVFSLKPEYYATENQYRAALRLCKECAGWYVFDSKEEQELFIECHRDVIRAHRGDPMWYYRVDKNSFDWLLALREQNEKYKGKFQDIDNLWELFSRLGARSFIEKADCFEWFTKFFKGKLKYDFRKELTSGYISYMDHMLENILYYHPEQMEILLEGETCISIHNGSSLAYAAAGLIRLGRKQEGIKLYKKIFNMIASKNTNNDELKRTVDAFMERLSAGYHNEPYVDEDISQLIEKQCKKFEDHNLATKFTLAMGKK